MLVNIILFYVMHRIGAPTICYILNAISLAINIYITGLDIASILDDHFPRDYD